MSRAPVAVMLWALLSLVLLAVFWLNLKACGIRLFGTEFLFCEAASEQGRPTQDPIPGLLATIRDLETQIADTSMCVGPPPQAQGRVGSGLGPVGGGAVPGIEGPAEAGATPTKPENGDVGDAGPVPDHDGGDDATTPQDSAGEPPPDETDDPSEAAACTPPTDEEGTYLVLTLDRSKSMDVPDSLSDEAAHELFTMMDSPNAATARAANRMFDEYVNAPGTKRLDALKQAVAAATENWPEGLEIDASTFAGCSGVSAIGTYREPGRADFLRKVDALRTASSTPLARAIEQSVARAVAGANGRPSRVVLVTDGHDSCGGDPCAAARAAAASGVPVDVIAIGGAEQFACIAEATGGRVLPREASGSLQQTLQEMIVPATDKCR